MNSVFPQSISVLVLDTNDNPIVGAPVVLELFVPLKNHYDSSIEATNADGIAVFTRSQLENGIDLDKRTFVMDYTGSIDDVYAIKARVLSRDAIDKVFEAQRNWAAMIPEYRLSDAMQQLLLRARDADYQSDRKRFSVSELTEQLCLRIKAMPGKA